MSYGFLGRGLAAVALAAVLVASPGCSLGGDDDFTGVWRTQGIDLVFLDITSQRITTYDFLGDDLNQGDDCYRKYVANIVTTKGNEYTVSSAAVPTLRTVMKFDLVDGVLTVTTEGSSDTFVRSTREVSSFTPLCE